MDPIRRSPTGPTARTLDDLPRASQQEEPPQPTCDTAMPPSVPEEVFQLVGLKLIDKMPPYVVEHGNGIMDVFGIYQGDAQYSNQVLQEGDTLLFVDGNDVAGLGPQGIVSSLRGQSMSQVHLVFSSRQNASLFRITVLRLVPT